MRRRADEIGRRLGQVKSQRAPIDDAEVRRRGSAMGFATRIAVELVAGVGVGGFIGWTLDQYLGTRPWLLIVFLMLGFAGGMLNMIRTARQMQASAEAAQRSSPSVKDDLDDDKD